jgi:hypothetical protein
MYYVIDYQGVIRYKWVGSPGEHVMDAALEKVILAAEERRRGRPIQELASVTAIMYRALRPDRS